MRFFKAPQSLYIVAALLFHTIAYAQAPPGNDTEIPLQSILNQFHDANFREKSELVTSLESIDTPFSIGILETLLAGEMYFERSNPSQLVRYQESDGDILITLLPELTKTTTLDSKTALPR